MKTQPGKSPAQAYREDLAFIHDAGFSQFARAAALLAIEELSRSGITGGCVVEFGCGSGVSSRAFRDAGFEVVGFDVSEPLIRMARRRVPGAQFNVVSLFTAKIPSCVAVTAIGEVLNYAFDSRNSRTARSELFGRIHEALRPGGLLVFDMAEPRRAPANGAQRSFVLDAGWAVLVEVEAHGDRTLLTRRITTFRQQGKTYRRGSEIHQLQLTDRAEIVGDLQRIGFSVEVMESYGAQPLLPGVAGFIAKKMGSSRAANAGKSASVRRTSNVQRQRSSRCE